jgi:hypothetical protein
MRRGVLFGMNRILKIHVNDLLDNPREASAMVNTACSHKRKMAVKGCCKYRKNIILSLEETETPHDYEYIFAQFPEDAEDGIIAEIDSRYYAGFTVLAGFRMKGAYWGLFAFDKSFRKKKRKPGK